MSGGGSSSTKRVIKRSKNSKAKSTRKTQKKRSNRGRVSVSGKGNKNGTKKNSGNSKNCLPQKRKSKERDDRTTDGADGEDDYSPTSGDDETDVEPSSDCHSNSGSEEKTKKKVKKKTEPSSFDLRVASINSSMPNEKSRKAFQDAMNSLCERADYASKHGEKSITGVAYVTTYRAEQLKKYVSIWQSYHEEPEGSELHTTLQEQKRDAEGSGAKHHWGYRFRLRVNEETGERDILQRQGHSFSSKLKKKEVNWKDRYDMIKDDEWVDVICADDPKLFDLLHSLHWHEDPSKHVKPGTLYEATKRHPKLNSNVTNGICSNIYCV